MTYEEIAGALLLQPYPHMIMRRLLQSLVTVTVILSAHLGLAWGGQISLDKAEDQTLVSPSNFESPAKEVPTSSSGSSLYQETDLLRRNGFMEAREATILLRVIDKNGLPPTDLRELDFALTVNGTPRTAHLHSPGSKDAVALPLVLLVLPPNQPTVHHIATAQARKYFSALASELLPWRVGILDANGKLTPFTNGRSQLLADLDMIDHTSEPFQYATGLALPFHVAWDGSWSNKAEEAISVMQRYYGPKIILAVNPLAESVSRLNSGFLAHDRPESLVPAAEHVGAHIYIANLGGPDTLIPGGDASQDLSSQTNTMGSSGLLLGSISTGNLRMDPQQTAALSSFAYRTSQMMQTATETLGGFSSSLKDLAAQIHRDFDGSYSLDFDLTPEDQDHGLPSVEVRLSRRGLKVDILDVVPVGYAPSLGGAMTLEQLAELTRRAARKPVSSPDYRIIQHVDYFPLHGGLTPVLPMSASVEWTGQNRGPGLISFVESLEDQNLSTTIAERNIRAHWDGRGLSWERDDEVRPGHYVWRVIVHDDSGEILATAQETIAVDFPRQVALRASSIVLGKSCREQGPETSGLKRRPPAGSEENEQSKPQIDPMRAADCRIKPEAAGRFASTDQLHAFIRIYPEEKYAQRRPENWTARFVLRSEAGVMEKEKEIPFLVDSGSGYVAYVELFLGGPGMSAGPHTLDVEVHGPGIRGDLKQSRPLFIQ